jgi:hypothetical protein
MQDSHTAEPEEDLPASAEAGSGPEGSKTCNMGHQWQPLGHTRPAGQEAARVLLSGQEMQEEPW